MTTEEVEFVKRTGRRPFKWKDILDFYFFIIFPLAIFSTGTFLFLNTYGNGDKEAFYSKIIFIVGFLSLLWTIKRLYDNQSFRRIRTSKDRNENILKIKKIIEYFEWELYLDNKDRIIAFTGTTWFSHGEQVTFVIDDRDILINSRPTKQPVTVFKDELNLWKIRQEFSES